MKKELNIMEAIKMPTETIFEVYYENGKKDARSAKVLEVFDGKCKKRLVWDNRADINVVVTKSILNATFIPIPQPVRFMEAWKAYQNGKAIKSLETKNRYLRAYSHIMVNINSQGKWLNDAIGIGYREMEGRWYIQEESEGEE